jgi:hypothetical protein
MKAPGGRISERVMTQVDLQQTRNALKKIRAAERRARDNA